MKKIVLVATAALLILLATASGCLILPSQPIHVTHETTESPKSREYLGRSADTGQDYNEQPDAYLPDGHIYWSPDAPYAYTPTYTPKKWRDITIDFNSTPNFP
jgi:hypothetical protein